MVTRFGMATADLDAGTALRQMMDDHVPALLLLREGMPAAVVEKPSLAAREPLPGQDFPVVSIPVGAIWRPGTSLSHAMASGWPWGNTAGVVGEPGRWVGVVTPAILAQYLWDLLQHLDSRLATVLDTVQEAVTVIDDSHQVVGWNRRAEEMYAIGAQEILGRPIHEYFQHLVVTRVLREGEPVRNAYHQPCAGKHVLINATPCWVNGRVVGSVSAERDITDLVNLHRELSRTNSQVRQLEREIRDINGVPGAFDKILGHSQRLRDTVAMAKRVASTSAAVLIRGESGTGKELFAEAIHLESARRDKPFVVINCGAIPPTLFESELFGYVSGAFTGADRRGKAGQFEAADGGTLFLDEIGELAPDLQVKILRALQQKVIYRVGSNQPIAVNVRVIAATHRDLERMIGEGRFREDLYYRLNVVSLEIPPLRDRKGDIPELVYAFLQEFAGLYQRHVQGVSPEVMALLLSHHWPGNVRELRNVIEHLVIMAEGEVAEQRHLPDYLRGMPPAPVMAGLSLPGLRQHTERELVLKAMAEAGGKKAEAARLLGIPRSTLYYRLRALGLDGDQQGD